MVKIDGHRLVTKSQQPNSTNTNFNGTQSWSQHQHIPCNEPVTFALAFAVGQKIDVEEKDGLSESKLIYIKKSTVNICFCCFAII